MSENKQAKERKTRTFHYHTDLKWLEGRRGELDSGEGKPKLLVGAPVDFKGEPGNVSPEDMMVSSLSVCQMNTFVAFARHKSLEFTAYVDSADGVVEVVDRKLRFTGVTLRPTVTITREDDREIALKLLEDAHHSCAISNSVNFEVVVEPTVVVA